MLARTRPQPGPFARGELLMYWRTHNLKRNLHAQWHGPARNLGQDVHGYWLVHRRIPLLCAPALLRRASQQEQDNFRLSELEGDEMRVELRGRRAGQLGYIGLRQETYLSDQPMRPQAGAGVPLPAVPRVVHCGASSSGRHTRTISSCTWTYPVCRSRSSATTS